MSLSADFPTTRPSLLLDFVNTQALDPRITFTRATTATYYDSNTVAKAEENLLLQSQELTTSPWTSVSASAVGSKTAPDGTATAIELTSTSTNGRTQQLVTIQSGQQYTFSMFVRRVTGTGNVNLIIADSGGTALFTTTMSLTSDWQRFTVSGAPAVGSISCRVVASVSGDAIEIWGAQLEQRDAVTAYTPTTTQPITNYIPVLLTAPAGQARFDFNPVTRTPNGLLVEEQRTNLVLRSEEFDNAAWTKTNATVTVNTIVAPNGTLTADELVSTASSGNHLTRQDTSTVLSNVTSTGSIYVKAGTINIISLALIDATTTTNVCQAFFNLSTGQTANVTNAGDGSGASANITAVGNNWYRCSLSGKPSTAGNNTRFVVYLSQSTSSTGFAGTTNDYVYIWGAQLEAGAFPTSYIPTVASSVTRNADAASMTGVNFSSWYNQGEGTLYMEASTGPIAGRFWAQVSDNSASNRIQLNTNPAMLVITTGTLQASLGSDLNVRNTFYKSAGTYKVNDIAFSRNGSAALTDTSATIPVVSQINIGSTFFPSEFLNSTIKKIAYYPFRLTDSQLQALTS